MKAQRVLVGIAAIALCWTFDVQAANIYWDVSHGVSDQYDPSGRYDVLIDHLAPLGYTFTEGTTSLDTAPLSEYDVLVLANGSCSSTFFSPSELIAIESYVRGGGGLLLLSDIAGSSGVAKIQQVAEIFGAQVGLSQFPGYDVYSTAVGVHPAVADVEQVYFRFSSTIAPGSLTPCAWRDSMPMMAVGDMGLGRVALIADGDLFTQAPSYPAYFDRADNRQLAVSTFGYLVPEPAVLGLLVFGAGTLLRGRKR